LIDTIPARPDGRSRLRRARSSLYLGAWSLFLIVFAGLGLKGGLGALQKHPISIGGPYATSDSWLAALQIPRPSKSIQDALTQLSPEGAILFVGPGHEPTFILTYYTISVLSWPRKMWALGCGEAGQPPTLFILPQEPLKIEGVMYYLSKPPMWLPGGRAIGPRVTLVRVPETVTWTQYCSQ
jgi:hypothetical protein